MHTDWPSRELELEFSFAAIGLGRPVLGKDSFGIVGPFPCRLPRNIQGQFGWRRIKFPGYRSI